MGIVAKDPVLEGYPAWSARVRELARSRNAIILAHNYQVPWIQDVADVVGDSLELSRRAADNSAQVIVFCGVNFMAETAKILSHDKTVLIPDPGAGCSLAASVTAEQLREWKAQYPGAVVVAYVNTSAEVKAEADYCCTSSNAHRVVEAIPPGCPILFLPDMFLGAHVERVTGRKMHLWMGECHVHAGISPADIERRLAEYPEADFYIHPECGCASQALYLASTGALPAERTHLLSTSGMIAQSGRGGTGPVIVATENGLLHSLRKANPQREFVPANDDAQCRYMKMITPNNLLECLENMRYEVTVPEDIARRAKLSLERMINL
ncbi:MAG: quinolinate synthase NadA [Actinomycetota bacterium]